MQRVIGHYLTREMAVLGLIEAVASFAAIYAVATSAGTSPSMSGFVDVPPYGRLTLAAVLALVTCVTGLAIGLHRTDVCLDRRRFFTTGGLAAGVAFAILLAFSGDLHAELLPIHALFIAKLLGVWLATVILTRLAYRFAARRRAPLRRVLLIGDPSQIHVFHARLRSRRAVPFVPVALDVPDISWSLLRQHRIWAIVIVSEPLRSTLHPLLDCKLRGVKILGAATFHENYLGRFDLETVSSSDLLMTQGFRAGEWAAVWKRLIDVIIGLSLLLLTLPIMVLTTLAIKLDGPGPVLYRQQRVGQFDQPFTLLKFRSMAANAEAGGSPRWAQTQDPRITRVGRFIRATHIDELPQLVNVLRGEMSLVGPRPERPHFVEQLRRAIPFYRYRSYVKPGLTGWAQINFRYGASVEDAREKLAYDLYYVKNRSVLLDAVILVSTVRVVLFGEGAR
jgi:sugar transferase (PEP-CTERM system associated)